MYRLLADHRLYLRGTSFTIVYRLYISALYTSHVLTLLHSYVLTLSRVRSSLARELQSTLFTATDDL